MSDLPIFGAGLVLGAVLAWTLTLHRSRKALEEERLRRAAAETRAQEMEKNLASQRELLAEAETRWKDAFENLSAKALTSLQEGARRDLGERQQSLESLLKPLQVSLQGYQQRLQQSETEQTRALTEVRKQVETLSQQNQSLTSETFQLRKVLSSNQARGRWGEEPLRRVVETAGMSAHCDFTEQTREGDGKPDLVVRLPGERVIVVDAKVPDLDFLTGLENADEPKRKAALEAHAAKLKLTIKALADRDYPAQFPNALDHGVLFMPAESLFSAALEGDRDLIVWAASKRILLATPASLIALLCAVALSWQQHQSTENARQIVEAGAELFERVSRFVEHLLKIRDGLQKAGNAFNDAIGSLERRVAPGADRLRKLGAARAEGPATEIPPLDTNLRQPPELS